MKTDRFIFWVEATLNRRRWTHSPWLTVLLSVVSIIAAVLLWRELR
jgi:ABC-type Fe3+-siderophore transport system permease subunit